MLFSWITARAKRDLLSSVPTAALPLTLRNACGIRRLIRNQVAVANRTRVVNDKGRYHSQLRGQGTGMAGTSSVLFPSRMALPKLFAATLRCSRARRRVCPFPAQDSGGRRQFHLLWWQALGRVFAEEHSDVFVYEPGVIVSSHDHACFEAQRNIGNRLYDHTVSMNASGRRLCKNSDSQVVRY